MHPFRAAFASRDFDALAAAVAPDVVLHSPISAAIDFEGRDEVVSILREVRAVFGDVDYAHDFGGAADEHVLVFHTTVRGRELHGADILRLDGQGLVKEIEVFIRPLTGLTTFAATLAPRLARQRGPLRGAIVAGLLGPLALMTRSGDRPVARLATGKKPRRA